MNLPISNLSDSLSDSAETAVTALATQPETTSPGSAIARPERVNTAPDFLSPALPQASHSSQEAVSEKIEDRRQKTENEQPPGGIVAEEFARLPEAARRDLTVWLEVCERWQRENGKWQMPGIAECKGVAGTLQVDWQRVYRHARAWQDSGGDWRSQVDKRLAGAEYWQRTKDGGRRTGLPPEFIEHFWGPLVQQWQRSTQAAWRELIHIWRNHQSLAGKTIEQIPGYDVWPCADSRTGLPRGWSRGRLGQLAPPPTELAVARCGRSQVKEFGTRVFSSRVGVQPGQVIIFDDQWYDLKVNFPGSMKAIRPLGLNALDLFSAAHVQVGFRPRLWIKDKTEGIKGDEMVWFVVAYLTGIGYRPDTGTVVAVEHGTAAITPEFEARIKVATGGKVTVARGGIGGAPVFDGLFEGQPRGNFRFKAPLESSFNLVRGEMAGLIGAVGKDREHCPEDIYGRDRYNERLLKVASLLSPDEAQQLMFPYHSWAEFIGLALKIYDRMNRREQHDLEGWEAAGLIAKEWRMAPDSAWQTEGQFHALPAAVQREVGEMLSRDEQLVRIRRLQPLEVWQPGRAELRRVPLALVPTLAGPELGQRRTVRGGYITIEDQTLDSAPLRFRAGIEGLEEGAEYLTYLNPFAADQLAVCDLRGQLVGVLARQAVPCRLDEARIHELMGQAKKEEAAIMHKIGVRGIERSQATLAMRKHNNGIIAGRKETPAPVRSRISADEFTSLAELDESPQRRAPGSDQEQAMTEL